MIVDVTIFFTVRNRVYFDILLSEVGSFYGFANPIVVDQVFAFCITVIKPALMVFGFISNCFFACFGHGVAERGPLLIDREILVGGFGESVFEVLLKLTAHICSIDLPMSVQPAVALFW